MWQALASYSINWALLNEANSTENLPAEPFPLNNHVGKGGGKPGMLLGVSGIMEKVMLMTRQMLVYF